MRRGNTHQTTTTAGTGQHHRDARRRSTGQPRRRTAAASIVLTAMVTALAGCTGGDPAPDWTPTTATPIVQPTPTPSTDPATIKPQRPTAMDSADKTGAEALARYFMQLYPYAYATGDLTDWQALSDPNCAFCTSVVENVEELVSAGHHNRGSEITFQSLTVEELSSGSRYGVEALVTEAPSAELDSTGEVIGEHSEPRNVTLVLALAYDGGWRVLEVDASAAKS